MVPAAGATGAPEALDRGRDLIERGRILSAEKALREAVREAPDSAEAHLLLGRVLAIRGDNAGAVTELQRAAELGASGPELDAALGVALYETGELDAARGYLGRALETEPDLVRARLYLGLAELAAGDTAAATAQFEQIASDTDPEYAQIAFYNLGMAYLEAQEPESARQALEQAGRIDPESAIGRRALSLAAEVPRPRRWSVSGDLGFLYDDNVSAAQADLSSGEGDGAFAGELSGEYRLVDSAAFDLEAGYDFYQTAYFRLNDFNQQLHGFHLDASREIWGVDAGLGYRYTLSLLGGDRFLDIHEVRPSFGRALLTHWYAVLTPRLNVKKFHDDAPRNATGGGFTFDNFLFLDGFQSYGILGVGFDGDDAKGAEFDFLGLAARVGLRHPFVLNLLGENHLRLELDYAFRLRDYRNITPSIGAKRHDKLHVARFRLARRISEHTEVRLDYEHTTSDSNLPSIDYGQNLVGMSFAFDF
jgi:Tfp pilus assembly protein PilF